MENELISRGAAIEALRGEADGIDPKAFIGLHEKRRMQGIIQGLLIAIHYLKYYVPAVDAKPVKRGHWRNILGDYTLAKCSECGEIYEVTPDEPTDAEYWEVFRALYRFCPRCGAKMDGEDAQ